MFTETGVTGSDDWWAVRLMSELGQGFGRMQRLQSYRDGTVLVPEWTNAGTREAYRQFMKRCRLNLAELISGTLVSRQRILGFRTAAPDDVDGDSAAWAHWKRSNMQVRSKDLLSDAADFGQAFITVTGPRVPTVDARPLFLPTNGWTTAAAPLTSMPWLNEYAVQVGHDPINRADIVTLFGPGFMRQAFRPARVSSIPQNGSPWSPGNGWEWVSDRVALGYTADNPVVSLTYPHGKGEYEKHTDSLDRINGEILDRLTISAMQAFRQRGIKGNLPQFYPDDHPRAGERINYEEIFKAGPAALWVLGDAEIWESQSIDITPILNAVKDDTKQLAAVTNTPMYVLVPDAPQGSAEGASLAREAFSFKVEDRNERAAAAIGLGQSLAFQAQGDSVRADALSVETIFAAVDRESITARTSAAVQAKQGGMSQRMIDEKIFQLTPAEISQERQNRADEAFAAVVV